MANIEKKITFILWKYEESFINVRFRLLEKEYTIFLLIKKPTVKFLLILNINILWLITV